MNKLKAYCYIESVQTRLNKANEKPIEKNADYRFVKLGDEIFPIHVNMIDVYNGSNRKFKRGMKQQYKKMVKKLNKVKIGELTNQADEL